MRKLVFISNCLVAAILMLIFGTSSTAVEPELNFDSVFKIIKSETNYSESPNCRYITCIGEIQNLTDDVWDDLVVEVKYFNSNGALIDTETESLYSYVLQAKDTIPFRVRIQADRDASEYISHSVRITSAEQKSRYESQNSPKMKSSLISNILISWAPMIILIGVWVFFMYFYLANKRSPQAKSIELLKNQAILIEKHNQLFERLVNAVENYKKE
jgi:ATP-dependent Zn protease